MRLLGGQRQIRIMDACKCRLSSIESKFFDVRCCRNYVDLATARSKGLVSDSGSQVTLRADSATVLNSTGPGRDSFDLVSKNKYTTHVAMYVLLVLALCR